MVGSVTPPEGSWKENITLGTQPLTSLIKVDLGSRYFFVFCNHFLHSFYVQTAGHNDSDIISVSRDLRCIKASKRDTAKGQICPLISKPMAEESSPSLVWESLFSKDFAILVLNAKKKKNPTNIVLYFDLRPGPKILFQGNTPEGSDTFQRPVIERDRVGGLRLMIWDKVKVPLCHYSHAPEESNL